MAMSLLESVAHTKEGKCTASAHNLVFGEAASLNCQRKRARGNFENVDKMVP